MVNLETNIDEEENVGIDLLDYLLVPSSIIRFTRRSFKDKEVGNLFKTLIYAVGGFAETTRVGIYYSIIAKPLYDLLSK